VIAVVAAAVSVMTALYGIYDRRKQFAAQQKKFEAEQKQWTQKFEAESSRWTEKFDADIRLRKVLLEKDFHLEQYRYRAAEYADVFRTLGALSDVLFPDRSDSSFRALHQNRELLNSTADALYDHLYDKAGLLMTMTTRNYVHTARRTCLDFLASDGDKNHGLKLINAFFSARRYLRADLELIDDRSPQSLEKLVNELGTEEAQSKATLAIREATTNPIPVLGTVPQDEHS
jgi:hypothetical protein